jgi:antitoxin component of MazEF toxin-antitoxin module
MGNSFGLIIPHEEVESRGIKEGDVVELEIEKRVNLAESFGSLRFSRTSQELKDEARAGWGE